MTNPFQNISQTDENDLLGKFIYQSNDIRKINNDERTITVKALLRDYRS